MRLNKITSLYLDLIRFIAAILVVFSHAVTFEKIKIPILSGYGSEAVAIFFVLSGYVISYVTSTKEKTASSYFKARAVRIYSVLIPAIIIGLLWDKIGFLINPNYYLSHGNFHNDFSIETLLKILSFSGEMMNTHYVFGSNEPIWSIQFECVYYIMFGLILFFSKKIWAWGLFFVICIFAFPKVLLYFPLWLIGVFIHKVDFKLNSHLASALFVISIFTILMLKTLPIPRTGMYREFAFTSSSLGSLIYFHLIGVFVALSIVTASDFFRLSRLDKLLLKFEGEIRYLSSNTFSLYLMHLPTMMLICVLIPPISLFNSAFGMVLVFLICFIFSFIFESKKGPMFKVYKKVRLI